MARRDPLLAGLTVRGRCLLAGGIAALVCAAILHEINLARIGVFLVVLPLLAYGMVARTRYRLTCTRRLEPVRVPAGDPARQRQKWSQSAHLRGNACRCLERTTEVEIKEWAGQE